MVIIRTVWVTYEATTPQCQKSTYVVWVSDEQKCKLQKYRFIVFSTLCRSVGCFVMWHNFSGRYLAWGIWFSQLCFIAHWSHTAALVALWSILWGGRMTKLHVICSVTWREQGLCIFYNPFHLYNIAETMHISTLLHSLECRAWQEFAAKLFNCSSVHLLPNFCLSKCDDIIRRNFQTIL